MYNWTAPPTFKFPPPVLKELETGARWYETHDGKKTTSASKVVGKPFDPYGWYEMCGGQKYGKKVNQIILDTGTLVHMNIERLLRNQPLPKYSLPDVQAHFGRISPLLQKINNITCCEQALYSPKLVISGTTDCIADYDGVRSIIDFKTSMKLKDDDDNESYYLQATLYARMWEEMTGEKIDNIAILMSVSGGQYKAFVKPTERYETDLDKKIQEFRESGGTQ